MIIVIVYVMVFVCYGIEGELKLKKDYQRFEFSGKMLSIQFCSVCMYGEQKEAFDWAIVILRVKTLTKAMLFFT